MEISDLNPGEFRIIINGHASTDPEKSNNSAVIDFQHMANVFFKMHKKQLEEMFNEMAPLQGSGTYYADFRLDSVDKQAYQ